MEFEARFVISSILGNDFAILKYSHKGTRHLEKQQAQNQICKEFLGNGNIRYRFLTLKNTLTDLKKTKIISRKI